jgi:hypothetical protein
VAALDRFARDMDLLDCDPPYAVVALQFERRQSAELKTAA